MNKLIESLAVLSMDGRTSARHVMIYTAIIQVCYQAGLCNPVRITRRRIMQLSRIRSTATYHKCLRELEQFGYIQYMPSYHPTLGSQVLLELKNSSIIT